MKALRFDDLKQYSDVVRSRGGEPVTVRFVEPGDAEELQNYFRSLSTRSRYNRFLGAMRELPHQVLDRFIHIGESDGFSVVATMQIDGFATIVGEARYAFHADTESLEFGLSIDDRWQGHGIGAALLGNLECRAAALGAARLSGDTLRSNDAMIGLARKSGFGSVANPEDIPCASWRIAAAGLALDGASVN
jgi:GNAT superfamily N-acetyltransferase